MVPAMQRGMIKQDSPNLADGIVCSAGYEGITYTIQVELTK